MTDTYYVFTDEKKDRFDTWKLDYPEGACLVFAAYTSPILLKSAIDDPKHGNLKKDFNNDPEFSTIPAQVISDDEIKAYWETLPD